MADKLVVDTDALSTAQNELQDECERMKKLKTKLHTSIEDLRVKGWQSEAGKAFFDKFDNTWENNLTNYISVLEYMAKNTNYAKNQYQLVIDEADRIQLS